MTAGTSDRTSGGSVGCGQQAAQKLNDAGIVSFGTSVPKNEIVTVDPDLKEDDGLRRIDHRLLGHPHHGKLRRHDARRYDEWGQAPPPREVPSWPQAHVSPGATWAISV